MKDEAFWRDYLGRGDSLMRFGRHVLNRIPSDPRCRLCASPFAGPGAPVMRLIGKRPSPANPNFCTSCGNVLIKHRGGAEVEGTMLFADIRGSTALAERISPAEFRDLLDRFYTAASRVVFANDGVVDKFVGDELVAIFPPLMGSDHPRRAIEAAQDLLRATGHGSADGPWVSIGAGVHTGRVWFGAVGDGSHIEITIVGDSVNTTARLAAVAQPGEILVSVAAAEAAGLDPDLERRALDLKGKELPVSVVSMGVGTSLGVASAD